MEGPSDQIYLREWIKMAAPEFSEGIDYTIMFYGGSLLSHVSSGGSEVGEFIALRYINRNMVIVMDSDVHPGRKKINATKQRIVDSWQDDGFPWVTAGREIENYVPPEAMSEALDFAEPQGAPHPAPAKRSDRCIRRPKLGESAIDKVKVARWLVNHQKLSLDPLEVMITWPLLSLGGRGCKW